MADPVLTPAALVKVNIETESAWPENQADIENKDVDAGTLDALLSHEKSIEGNIIEKITDPKKDYDANILWYDMCGDEATTCAQDPCTDLTGDGNDAKSQQITIAQCAEDAFSVSETQFAGTSLDMQAYVVMRQNRAIKNIVEKINGSAIAFLSANAGYNRSGFYPYAGGVTSVPAADYNTSLMTQIMFDMVVSKIKNPFAIDGGSLWVPFENAGLNFGNGEGKGDKNRAGLFDMNYDLIGMRKAGMGDRTFLVTPYAYAFLNKNYIMTTVPTYDGTIDKLKYSIKVPSYGITIDVWHQRTCENGTKDRFKHNFLYKAHYDFALNPTGCDDGGIVTGIAEYKKVA